MRLAGNLQQVFEESDAPANEDGDVPCSLLKAAEMPVPGEGHEDVGQRQQKDGLQQDRHDDSPG
jgi:hypothetical protein